MIYYFICLPIFLLIYMAQNLPGKKYAFQQGSIPYQRESSIQSREILLDIYYWTLWFTLQCNLKWLLILWLPIQDLKCWFHLFWFLYTDKNNAKKGRGKRARQKYWNFRHKGKYKIGCYSKSLQIFSAYQVQMWWNMILIPVKYQPYGRKF